MFTQNQLIEMRQRNIQSIEEGSFTDLQSIAMDPSLPRDSRLEIFSRHAADPYCVRCGEIKIKLEFAEDSPSLQEVFSQLLIRRKSQ